MMLEELFENGVSMVKTVWKRRGESLSRHEVRKMIATNIKPRINIEIKDDEKNE